MFKTIRNAFKVKELREKILYTLMMLVVIRFGCQLPIPGIETTFFKDWFAKQTADVFGFFNAMTGDSFSNMSIFALSITPYITSSIIIQLLTIAIPKLEEMQKDGEEGRKKIQEYTRYTTVALALLESSAMAIGFGRQGLLHDFNAWNVIIAVITMTTGSALLMWIGEQITSKGVGNGISIVLLFNILSSIPDDIKSLYYRFIFGQSITKMIFSVVAIGLWIILVMVATQRTMPRGEFRSSIPRRWLAVRWLADRLPTSQLKINTAGVMPVIFASSIMSFPVVIFSVLYD